MYICSLCLSLFFCTYAILFSLALLHKKMLDKTCFDILAKVILNDIHLTNSYSNEDFWIL